MRHVSPSLTHHAVRSGKRTPAILTLLALAACKTSSAAPPAAPVPAVAQSARPAEWGYEGSLGPAAWSQLNPAYSACTASHQSPLDLNTATEVSATSWTLNYKPSALKIAHHEHVTDILDNGHTIQVTVDEGSTLVTGQGTYQLKQFHFHTPSEHTVDGKSFPMEAHFVHQSAEGKFAVVSVLFSEGAASENLATLVAHFPEKKGDAKNLPDVMLNLGAHVPAASPAHYYVGSFTTPPCTEGVEWLVFRTPMTASADQLAAFAGRLNHNNRPLQPGNGRPIIAGTIAGSVAP